MLADAYPDLLLTCQHHIGDAYEIPFTSQRDAFYGVSGYPTVIIDGVATIVGAGSCEAAYAQYRAAFLARMEQTGWVSPVSITGDFSHDGATLSVTTSFRLVDPIELVDPYAVIVVLENGIVYGPDNKHVTRAGYQVPVPLEDIHDIAEVNRDFTIQGWNMDNVEVIAFLQSFSGDKGIYGGRNLPAVADFSAYLPVSMVSIPAGNGLAEFEGTIRNISLLADELTVRLDNTFGWPAEFKLEGEPDFHTDPSLVALAPEEEITFHIQVTTDADVRIGVGGLEIESANTGTVMPMQGRIFNGSPAVLMVDDDMNRDDEIFVLNALDDAGYLYDHWDVYFGHGENTPNAADMDPYDLVFWHCGWKTTDLVTTQDAEELMTFMDTGRGVVLSSQDALSGPMPATFTQDYLGVASWTENVGADAAVGVGGDPVTDGMDFVLDYPHWNVNRADDIVPNAIGTVILHSELNDRISVRADNGTARSVFLAFGVNAMDETAPDPNNPATLFGRALGWVFQGQSQAVPPGQLGPALSQIQGIEPNPFSPFGLGGRAATIHLRIADGAASDRVTLDLIDVNGRKLQRLLGGSLPAGAHTVAWDGRDAGGRLLSGGVYFMRLSTAVGEHSTPVIVVR